MGGKSNESKIMKSSFVIMSLVVCLGQKCCFSLSLPSSICHFLLSHQRERRRRRASYRAHRPESHSSTQLLKDIFLIDARSQLVMESSVKRLVLHLLHLPAFAASFSVFLGTSLLRGLAALLGHVWGHAAPLALCVVGSSVTTFLAAVEGARHRFELGDAVGDGFRSAL